VGLAQTTISVGCAANGRWPARQLSFDPSTPGLFVQTRSTVGFGLLPSLLRPAHGWARFAAIPAPTASVAIRTARRPRGVAEKAGLCRRRVRGTGHRPDGGSTTGTWSMNRWRRANASKRSELRGQSVPTWSVNTERPAVLWAARRSCHLTRTAPSRPSAAPDRSFVIRRAWVMSTGVRLPRETADRRSARLAS
jgi:hypothetical protein